MRKSQITRLLSLILTMIVFIGLGFLYSHCAMQRLDRPNYGYGNNNTTPGQPPSGNSNNPRSGNNNPQSGNNDSTGDTSPKDTPEPRQPTEEWSEAHKKLRKKYNAWVNLDIGNDEIVSEFLSGRNIESHVDRVRAYFSLSWKAISASIKREHLGKFGQSSEYAYGGRIEVLVELEQADNEEITIDHPYFESGSGGDNQYNVWASFPHFSQDYSQFHGFFQNNHGALVLVVDEVRKKSSDQEGDQFYGDGGIWFQKFKRLPIGRSNACNSGGSYVSLGGYGAPNKKCWFIGIGPYSCRTWKHGNEVNPFKILRPLADDGVSDCYQLLGEFEDLNLKAAFDLEGDEEFLPR